MPSIKIREIDTTSPGALENITNVVYVPGFINPSYINSDGTSTCVDAFVPTLCTSILDFENNFGSIPASFMEDQLYSSVAGFAANAIPTNDNVMFHAGTMDLGYIYAKELLTAGLPVLYERINTEADGSDVTIEHIYTVLNESNDISIWENLKDINEYDELKFLTSGGYPTFEYSDNKLVISGKDLDMSLVEFDPETFMSTMFDLGLNPDTTKSFTFKYANALNDAIYFSSRKDLFDAYSFVKPTGNESFYITDEKVLLVPSFFNDDEEIPEEVALEDGSALEEEIQPENPGNETTDKLIFNGFVEVPENQWKIWTPTFISTDGGEIIEIPTIKDFGITFKSDDRFNAGDSIFPGATLIVTWPVTKGSSIAAKMLSCAANRGDCVALIDHTDCYDRPVNANDIRSVYYSVASPNSDYSIKANGEFGAMFTPWCGYSFTSALVNTYNRNYAIAPRSMAPSFFYLLALAKQVDVDNSDWLAIAGSKRGPVNITKPNLISTLRMSSTIADSYQPRNAISINAIANIKPFGYVIWGNRTLANNATKGNLVATSFLNVRNIISSVKKTAFLAAKYCMFEQNSDILWLNYTNYISTELDELVSAAALNDYTITQLPTTEKAKLVCKITLYPIYAVEAFDITVELADDEITVE